MFFFSEHSVVAMKYLLKSVISNDVEWFSDSDGNHRAVSLWQLSFLLCILCFIQYFVKLECTCYTCAISCLERRRFCKDS